jgi:hypothetical protein
MYNTGVIVVISKVVELDPDKSSKIRATENLEIE